MLHSTNNSLNDLLIDSKNDDMITVSSSPSISSVSPSISSVSLPHDEKSFCVIYTLSTFVIGLLFSNLLTIIYFIDKCKN